jgi:hypothetical protein
VLDRIINRILLLSAAFRLQYHTTVVLQILATTDSLSSLYYFTVPIAYVLIRSCFPNRFLTGTESLWKRGPSIMMTRGRFCQQMLSLLATLWAALLQEPQLCIQSLELEAFKLLSLYPAHIGMLPV